MRISTVALVAFLDTTFGAFAQPPHEGTWAIDYASSDPGCLGHALARAERCRRYLEDRAG